MPWTLCLWLLYTFQVIQGYYQDYLYPNDEATSNLYISESDALDRFQKVQRRSYRRFRERRSCRRWNSYCYPWSKRADYACCYHQGLSCQCNLWMQNCRCVSKLWGR